MFNDSENLTLLRQAFKPSAEHAGVVVVPKTPSTERIDVEALKSSNGR